MEDTNTKANVSPHEPLNADRRLAAYGFNLDWLYKDKATLTKEIRKWAKQTQLDHLTAAHECLKATVGKLLADQVEIEGRQSYSVTATGRFVLTVFCDSDITVFMFSGCEAIVLLTKIISERGAARV